MERISALIEKLRDQFAEGAGLEQLLLTTQLLEGELRYHRQKGTVPAAPLVAVLLPTNTVRPKALDIPDPDHEKYLPPKEKSVNGYSPEPAKRPAPAPLRPVEPIRASIPFTMSLHDEEEQYNPLNDVPTLAHQMPQEARKELNEAIGKENTHTSLNDTLKGQQKELSATLTEAPIRDLRKGIGINDRYVFISELFRGDEIMYERSIKTINNFSIYQEAYYWMERELKLKLAWDPGKYSTQLFYQLVRRRFS